MRLWTLPAAIVAALSFAAAVAGFGGMLEAYSQAAHPVGLLGARGVPHAPVFNAFGFVLPGLLAAFVAWRVRTAVGDAAPWAARIGGWVALLSALAFAAQGVLPLDPGDLESTASRAHATAWTLWWVAFVPAGLLLAIGLRSHRELALASLVAVMIVVALAVLPLDLLVPAVAQRTVFAVWLAWLVLAGRWVASQAAKRNAAG